MRNIPTLTNAIDGTPMPNWRRSLTGYAARIAERVGRIAHGIHAAATGLALLAMYAFGVSVLASMINAILGIH